MALGFTDMQMTLSSASQCEWKKPVLLWSGCRVAVHGAELKLQLIGRRDAATALLYLNALHAVCRAVVSQSV